MVTPDLARTASPEFSASSSVPDEFVDVPQFRQAGTVPVASGGGSDAVPQAAANRDSDRLAAGAGSAIPIHRNRSVISVLAGIVGFFAVWGYASFLGSGGFVVATFLDIPTALLVALTPVTILTAVYGWAGVVDALAWIFRKPAPGKAAEDAVVFFQLGAAFALAGGFLTTMIGLIITLRHMGEPHRMGPGMAVALLSQLYGVFLAVICIAVAAHIARRHNGPQATAPLAQRAAGVAGITAIAGTLTVMIIFGVIMLSVKPNW